MLVLIPVILLSYLAGSFPTSIIVGKIFFKKDIRKYGSGNAVGMLSVPAPVPLCIAVFVFTLILLTTGIVSLGSIAGAVVFPAGLLVQYAVTGTVHISLIIFSVMLGSLIIFTHRSNIRRLINGTENRFDNLMIFRKKKAGLP